MEFLDADGRVHIIIIGKGPVSCLSRPGRDRFAPRSVVSLPAARCAQIAVFDLFAGTIL